MKGEGKMKNESAIRRTFYNELTNYILNAADSVEYAGEKILLGRIAAVINESCRDFDPDTDTLVLN